MSQIEPTDLLCRSRREELSADERRRLNDSLERSLEVRLMSQMLSELERESRVRPGDDLLLARISARALGAPEAAPAKRRALRMLLIAAAVSLLTSFAGAWLLDARKPALAPSPPATPSAAARPKLRVASTPRVVPEIPSETPIPAASGSASGSRRAGEPPKAATSSSASELFARANLLRRQGRGVEAAGIYQLLLELYPNAREVGPTRLALAKYFQAKEPERALAQYRAAASSGGSLRAEALWGISEITTKLGQGELAEQARADLLREFPDSPYAEVARARTSHGSP